ncbi:hypothetical protein COLO4_29886 [Corchorus olitorius]|uniref:Uncharacterized protein n=1 Tax=Corchorus olitorius TaxID=93759 RepID=A0A1R3HCR7_9ROSI|nr:hypothetical protein COLO4_29886 [Corchorus olitorius]
MAKAGAENKEKRVAEERRQRKKSEILVREGETLIT